MRSGAWYAAALGDPASRSLHPEAPALAPGDPRTWDWQAWPWPVLARLAIAAARLHADLLPATAHVTGDDVPAALALLARLERWAETASREPFAEAIRPDFASGHAHRPMRRRARWSRDAAFGARTAIWAAARAAGPCFQARQLLDPDAPRAAQLAVLHAASARRWWDWARPGVGDAHERKLSWSRMAAADRERAAVIRRRTPGAAARARAHSSPDPAPAMSARAAALDARAARLDERARSIAVDPPDPARALEETFVAVRSGVVPWLLAQSSFPANPIVIGPARVAGGDGVVRLLEYAADGRLVAERRG